MAHKFIPPYTVSLPREQYVDTTELLEELGISYTTLHSRIKRNNFPAPVRSGHNGKSAQYLRADVIQWLKKHGFRVEE